MYPVASLQMSGVTYSITFTGKNITRHEGFVSHAWQAWILGNIVIAIEGRHATQKPPWPRFLRETPVILMTSRSYIIGYIHVLYRKRASLMLGCFAVNTLLCRKVPNLLSAHKDLLPCITNLGIMRPRRYECWFVSIKKNQKSDRRGH